MVAAEPLPDDDADVSETPPVTETILPSSNQAPVNIHIHLSFVFLNRFKIPYGVFMPVKMDT